MPDDQQLVDAYKHLKSFGAAAEALDEAAIINARVSRERFLELVSNLAERIGPVLTTLAPIFKDEHLASLRAQAKQLVPLGLAFFAADLDTEAGYSDADKTRRAWLAQRVRTYDRNLFPVVELLWGSHPVHGATVDAIRTGSGLRDDAADVLSGARLVADDPSTFAKQHLVSPDDAATWAQEATELLTLVDRAEAKNPARTLKQRIFTLGVRAFDTLNWVGRFATRELESWPAISARQAMRAPVVAEPEPPMPA